MEITDEQVSHIVYADESNYNTGRYRALCLVSLKVRDDERLSGELKNILQGSGVTEFKWKKLDSAQYRFAALKMIDRAIEYSSKEILRIDVLTWDIRDSRHSIVGRDDLGNLQRMYHHLLKNVLCERWPDGSIWQLCPDEQTAIEWRKIGEFLDMKNSNCEVLRDLFTMGKFKINFWQEFKIRQIAQTESVRKPLIQLADLFAGMAVYSRDSYDKYEYWQDTYPGDQFSFQFAKRQKPLQLSKSDRERCLALAKFNVMCKKHKMGVSLKTNRGLRTFNPNSPINFWWYEPQHNLDKAPTRIEK